jgi:hypothetical protein
VPSRVWGGWRYEILSLSLSLSSFIVLILIPISGIQSAPGNDVELMAIMCMAVAFSMIYVYVVATLTALLTSIDMQNVLYREKMDKVSIYLNSKTFPRDLHLKVLRYFKHYYGTESTVSNESEILENLDTNLRRQVASVLSESTFRQTHLFSDFHRDVHIQLLSLLRPLHLGKGETLFEAGSFGTEIFIVRHGHVRGIVCEAGVLRRVL